MPYLIAVLSVVVIVVFAAVVWRLAVWQNRRCFALLDDWAARNGFRIIERTYEQLWHAANRSRSRVRLVPSHRPDRPLGRWLKSQRVRGFSVCAHLRASEFLRLLFLAAPPA